jgi:hypothetical protein
VTLHVCDICNPNKKAPRVAVIQVNLKLANPFTLDVPTFPAQDLELGRAFVKILKVQFRVEAKFWFPKRQFIIGSVSCCLLAVHETSDYVCVADSLGRRTNSFLFSMDSLSH